MPKHIDQLMMGLTALVDERIAVARKRETYVTQREAAEMVRCGRDAIRDAIKNDQLPAKKAGRSMAILVADLLQWNEQYRLKESA